jgi:hypothetical protein
VRKEDYVMTRIELPFETACDSAAATFSSLAAMLHFHRTGERYKPRLVVVNKVTMHRRRAAPRPALRVVSARLPQLSA